MKFFHYFAFLCVVTAGLFIAGYAQTPQEQALSHAEMQNDLNPLWRTQKWDEKVNKPYADKAHQIEKLLQQKVEPLKIISKYEAAARANPRDSLAIFPWVYARYRVVEADRIRKPLAGVCYELHKVLVMAPPPPSAEYTLLRFKVEARWRPSAKFKKVGQRLMERYKKDLKLALVYNGVLIENGELETVIRNEYALVKKYPKEPDYRYALGSDLTVLSWKKRDPKLLDAGAAQLDIFEKLAPPNHLLRRYLPGEREYIRLKRLRFAGKKP